MRRRRFLALTAATAGSLAISRLSETYGDEPAGPPIATNSYPWTTFARRKGEAWTGDADDLAAVAASGIGGYEPAAESADRLTALAKRLPEHGLTMRSIYVNSVLHESDAAEQSIADVTAIADAAKRCGVSIVVTNPTPIRWGGTEDKTDRQLRTQADALSRLGAALAERSLTLAYHNHDAELRQGGREFHHMLTATDPAHVKFCLDAHWIYRGCGNSEVALFDAIAHYKSRIVELHLRQSTDGIWNEVFTIAGDIDYARVLAETSDTSPHLVLEQAVEAKSPRTLTATAAHRQSYQNLREAVTS